MERDRRDKLWEGESLERLALGGGRLERLERVALGWRTKETGNTCFGMESVERVALECSERIE